MPRTPPATPKSGRTSSNDEDFYYGYEWRTNSHARAKTNPDCGPGPHGHHRRDCANRQPAGSGKTDGQGGAHARGVREAPEGPAAAQGRAVALDPVAGLDPGGPGVGRQGEETDLRVGGERRTARVRLKQRRGLPCDGLQ